MLTLQLCQLFTATLDITTHPSLLSMACLGTSFLRLLPTWVRWPLLLQATRTCPLEVPHAILLRKNEAALCIPERAMCLEFSSFLVRLRPICLRHPNQPCIGLMDIKDGNHFHSTQHRQFQGGESRAQHYASLLFSLHIT